MHILRVNKYINKLIIIYTFYTTHVTKEIFGGSEHGNLTMLRGSHIFNPYLYIQGFKTQLFVIDVIRFIFTSLFIIEA